MMIVITGKSIYKSGNIIEQECILVGCVPTAAVAISGEGSASPDQTPTLFWPEIHPPRKETPRKELRNEIPLPVNIMTHACENITFPHTPYAVGKNIRKKRYCCHSVKKTLKTYIFTLLVPSLVSVARKR